MGWEPKYAAAQGVGLVVENILNYVRDNAGAALTWANGSPLPDFKQIYNSSAGRAHTNFPDLMVITKSEDEDEGEDGAHLANEITIGLEMEIAGSNADELTLSVDKYVKALKMMLRTMTSAQLTAGMGAAWGATVGRIRADYDQLRGGANAYLQTPRVVVTINLKERIGDA